LEDSVDISVFCFAEYDTVQFGTCLPDHMASHSGRQVFL